MERDKQYILDRIYIDNNGCWIWQRSLHSAGYGQLGIKPYTAHKLAYILWKGEPTGVVRHKCHTPSCCNPDHLIDGTYKDNWLDSEEVHRQVSTKRRGLPAHNRHKIRFRNKVYESKHQAVKEAKVTWKTLLKECELI